VAASRICIYGAYYLTLSMLSFSLPSSQVKLGNIFYKYIFLALAVASLLSNPKEAQAMNCPESLSFQFLRLQDETPQDLCQYKGKVILVVNTASYCGFTSQYEGLEKIYAQYKDQGFVVLCLQKARSAEKTPTLYLNY
jgi:glutathione peroxidase